jgi:pyruvate/2-oxoglutarate dehydrogenase complex dihydrolipoamide dehydrogenase (E3) component
VIRPSSPLLEPWDEHNRALVELVRPPTWVNPAPAARYNLVVLGAGTAGLVAAAGAAGLGARVALVERHLLGGDCLNYGCVPSKALIRAARAAHDAAGAGAFGVRVTPGGGADFAAVMERVRRVRAGIARHDAVARLAGTYGVDVFLGEGRFCAPDCIAVEGRRLRFAKAVIATGARALRPPIPGLEAAGFLTNETVFSLTALPARLGVVGGGPLGCELAQAFRRLGSAVTVVDAAPRLLPREDPDAAEILRRAFGREGIELVLGEPVAGVETGAGGKRVLLGAAAGGRALEVDEILIGAGRVPNVDGLGLELAGVAFDRTGIGVDDHLRTSNRRIFAAGDVCLALKFTHTADAAARIVVRNALFGGRARVSALTVPWCTYTDPEIAHVGLHEADAAARGLRAESFTVDLADVDRALLDGEAEGFARLVVRRGSDRLLGATIVARHAGEMIGEVGVAMAAGVGLAKLSGVIHPYPTQAEAIRRAADAYQRTRITPGIRRLLERWFAFARRG